MNLEISCVNAEVAAGITVTGDQANGFALEIEFTHLKNLSGVHTITVTAKT